MSAEVDTLSPWHELPEPPMPQTLEDVIVMQRAMSIRIDAIERNQEAQAVAQATLADTLKANTDATTRTEKNTADLVELFNTFRAGFKALNLVAKIIAPLSAIGGAVLAAWSAWSKWKHGG